MDKVTLEQHIRDEIEFARALTAVLLAVRLDVAETKAQEAYEKVVGAGHEAEDDLTTVDVKMHRGLESLRRIKDLNL